MLQRKHLFFLLVTPIVVIADQVTKTIAQKYLSSRIKETIIPDYLDLVLVKNRGMAFGLFNNLEAAWRIPLLAVVSVVAVFIIIHLYRQAKSDAVFLPLSLSIILSGAIGNFLDRLRWGYVVDFITVHYHKHDWPTFNVADAAITAGIIILIIDTLFNPSHQPETETGKGAGTGKAVIEGETGETD